MGCDFPPWSRYGTSLEAAASVAGSAAKKQRQTVLDFIRSKGEYGATDDEIITELGIGHNALHPRRWELAGLNRKSDMPKLIAHNGERRKTRTGHP